MNKKSNFLSNKKTNKNSHHHVKKHKFSPSCLNNCIDWTMTVTYNHEKSSITNTLKGKNLFFRTLEKSALNTLQQNGGLKDKDILDSPTYSDTSAKQIRENDFSDIMNIRFPINNNTFNYMIIDANLGIKENLQNIFLLEFDLNIKDVSLKHLREINAQTIERELFFTLNGTIHGIPLFSSELKFSVEQRKFIKSIQFRLETYKNELLTQRQMHPESPKNTKNGKIRNNFFAKILSNTNIGIEFYKPNRNEGKNLEKFMTNFNSIVNSKISLNKFFLEVCIPKSFVVYENNNEVNIIPQEININNFNKDNTNKNNNQLNSKIDFSKDISIDRTSSTTGINNTNNTYANAQSNLYTNFKQNLYSKSSLKDKPIKIPPLYTSDFTALKQRLYDSPNIGSLPRFFQKNDLSYIRQNGYLSPEQFNQSYLPPFYCHITNISGINSTFSPSVNFSLLSRRCSESFTDSFIPDCSQNSSRTLNRNNLNNIKFNLNDHNNLSVRSFGGMNYYDDYNIFNQGNFNINLNKINSSCYSPRTESKFNMNYFNNSNFAGFAGIPTIMQKINEEGDNVDNIDNIENNININMEDNVYKDNEDYHNYINNNDSNNDFNNIENNINDNININNIINNVDINSDNNNIDNIFDGNNNEDNIDYSSTQDNIDIYYQNYEGMSNFMILYKKCTPYILKSEISKYGDIKLIDFFEPFKNIGLFGLKVKFLKDQNKIMNTFYTCTLSSLVITFNNEETILKIIDILISLDKCSPQIKTFIKEGNIESDTLNYQEFVPNDKNSCLKVILNNLNSLTIEYHENKQYYFRNNIYSEITSILSLLNINDITINNITSNSWFTILYTPLKSDDKIFCASPFIAFYQFKYSEESLFNDSEYIEIPLLGLLPIKYLPKVFLEKICYDNILKIYDGLSLNSSIQNITNTILKNLNRKSIDIEHYIKNKQNNTGNNNNNF